MLQKADIGITCLSITKERLKAVDFTSSFMEAHASAIYIPEDQDYSITTVKYLNPFQWKSWLLIIFMPIVGTLVFVLMALLKNKCSNRTSSPNEATTNYSLRTLDFMAALCQQSKYHET